MADPDFRRMIPHRASIPALPPDFNLFVRIRGLKIRVELEPGCLGEGRRIRLRVWHRIAGSAGLVGRRRYGQATEADVTTMLRRLRLAPCTRTGCRNHRLLGDDRGAGGKAAICEPHRLKAVHAAAAKDRSRKQAQPSAYDAWMRRRGFRYLATVWIYRGNRDESAVELYYAKRPTRSQLRKEAARRQSFILDDFSIEKL